MDSKAKVQRDIIYIAIKINQLYLKWFVKVLY